MKRLLILTAILTLMVGAANSQVLKPVKWQISFKKVSEGVYDIICKATIESGWHLYDTKLPENGPLPTTFNLDEDETKDIELYGMPLDGTELADYEEVIREPLSAL